MCVGVGVTEVGSCSWLRSLRQKFIFKPTKKTWVQTWLLQESSRRLERCYGLDEKCLLQVCVLEHLVPSCIWALRRGQARGSGSLEVDLNGFLSSLIPLTVWPAVWSSCHHAFPAVIDRVLKWWAKISLSSRRLFGSSILLYQVKRKGTKAKALVLGSFTAYRGCWSANIRAYWGISALWSIWFHQVSIATIWRWTDVPSATTQE